MFKFLVFILVSLIAFSAATNVRKCANGQPFPLSVDVEGCSQMPCKVMKGKTAVMNVNFLGTKDNIRTLDTKVTATVMGVTVPYELPKDVANVCANLMNGASCPINQNEDVVYKFNFYVDTYYPAIPVSVEISLNDENNLSVTCFICDIRVKNV